MINRIVLVANIKKAPNSGYKKHMSSLDFSKHITNILIGKAIKKSGYELTKYSNIEDFVKNIDSHKNDLVFPYNHGIASKIRQSYVQTICESYNIKYLGADAYSQTITNDKALSKEICRHSGIFTPNCKIFFDENYPPDITSLKLPIIIKPQFEADSIGISDANVFYSYDGILSFATNLFDDLKQPIIIEEFIEGRELSISLIGYKRKIKQIGTLEYIKGESLVSSYKDKKFNIRQQYKEANNLINDELLNKVTNLFHSLDKIEFMRQDFIYKNEIFYNVELTADPSLAPRGCMYLSLKQEMKYEQFIEFLILNCLERYKAIGEL